MPVLLPPGRFSEETRGAVYVLALYVAVFVLHLALPPWEPTEGYACDCRTRQPLRYRYNGLRVLIVVIVALCTTFTVNDLADLAVCFWPMVYTACALGFSISMVLYVRGATKLRLGLVDKGACCLTVNGKRSKAAASTKEFDGRSIVEHFYCGIEWNPRVLGVDLKMFNYLVGAVALACNIVGAVALHILSRDDGAADDIDGGAERLQLSKCSNAMLAYLIPMGWFIAEYMWHEHVHVYTYDIFRERLGAKMCWGCFCFYPFFYCVGVWPLVGGPHGYQNGDLSLSTAATCFGLFLFGWLLTRGANLQKFYFRTEKSPTFFFGLIQNVAVPGSRGRILCSGFWGVSRHINYLGELIQASALALPGWIVSGSLLPWLYPMYYVLLFIPRDLDDDEICSAKYGSSWEKYRSIVPYRIVPGLY